MKQKAMNLKMKIHSGKKLKDCESRYKHISLDINNLNITDNGKLGKDFAKSLLTSPI